MIKTQKFLVNGMACSACQSHVEAAVRELNGVKTVQVSLLTKEMLVAYDPQETSETKIIKAVVSKGFTAEVFRDPESFDPAEENLRERAALKKRFIVSLLFLLPLGLYLVILKLTKTVSLASVLSTAAVTVYGFWTLGPVPEAWALLALALLVLVRHRGNLRRVARGTERKISWM